MSEGLYCTLLIGSWFLVAFTLIVACRWWILNPRVLSDPVVSAEQKRKFPGRLFIGVTLAGLLATLTFRILVEMHKL
ncbi:MAG: hypothetical protein AAB575_02510 [Patescibacteria group bacterium]